MLDKHDPLVQVDHCGETDIILLGNGNVDLRLVLPVLTWWQAQVLFAKMTTFFLTFQIGVYSYLSAFEPILVLHPGLWLPGTWG